MQVNQLEVEIGIATGYVLTTPANTFNRGIEAVVFALWGKISGERQRHSSNATPDVQNLVFGTQLSILDEVAQMLFAGRCEISITDKTPQTARRNMETTGGIDEVENRSLRVFQCSSYGRRYQPFQC